MTWPELDDYFFASLGKGGHIGDPSTRTLRALSCERGKTLLPVGRHAYPVSDSCRGIVCGIMWLSASFHRSGPCLRGGLQASLWRGSTMSSSFFGFGVVHAPSLGHRNHAYGLTMPPASLVSVVHDVVDGFAIQVHGVASVVSL